jgi:hypothetical protein
MNIFHTVKNVHLIMNITKPLKAPFVPFKCRLGGVVVSVFATGPKGCGFEPGQGDGFLSAIKIRSTPSFRMGSNVGGPMS